VRPAAEAEKLGIPSVVVTVPGFINVAKAAAKAAGVPGLRLAEYPGAVGIDHAEIRSKVKASLFDQIIAALTEPVQDERTASPAAWHAREIVCSGSLADINRFFAEREWTDGLPIMPPTPQAIDEFLQYTDRDADETIAILPQANLRATPRVIAANGVMAGCRPEHMPILIALTEALGDERYNLNNIGTTWGIVPYLIINGPIVRQLGIHSEEGLISRGPNPALGRAMGLIIRNIGGYKPGRSQMGSFGYPLPFAFAENEAANPWEPLHVERGFEREASTVSIGSTLNWGFSPSPYTREDRSGAQTALELFCIEARRKPCLGLFAESGPKSFINDITFLIAPPVARALADGGYTKAAIKDYVWRNAKVPLRELEWELRYGLAEVHTVREKVELGLFTQDFLVGPGDEVPIIPSPDLINLVVCGDPGRNRIKTFDSGYTLLTTREIKLPAKWDRLPKG
jgi:hypothetical protein